MFTKLLLLGLFFPISYLYFPLNKRPFIHHWKTFLDDKLPLVPWFVIPYIALLPIFIMTVIALFPTPHFAEMMMSFILAYLIATTVWYLFPNGIHRQPLQEEGRMHTMINWFYRNDGATNGFPSAHVFSALLCGYFLSLVFPSLYLLFWSISLMISLSTVFVKQHYVVDIGGGLVTALISLWLTTAWFY